MITGHPGGTPEPSRQRSKPTCVRSLQHCFPWPDGLPDRAGGGCPPAANRLPSLPELDGHWSQSAFERWHGYGIVEGDVRGMRPDDAITAGEFAALLCRAMGYTDTVDNPYADLKGDEWYAPYILRLTAAGILEGDGVNCNPNAPMGPAAGRRPLCPGHGHPPHGEPRPERLCRRP